MERDPRSRGARRQRDSLSSGLVGPTSGQDVAPSTVRLELPLFLPSINTIQARLLFVQRGDIEVGLAGDTGFGVLTPGADLRLTVTRSSNPNTGQYGRGVVFGKS